MRHRTMCCQNLLQIPTPDEGIAELCINEETSTDYKATLISVTDSDSDIPPYCKECKCRRIVDTEQQHTCKHVYRPIEYHNIRTGYEQCEKCGHIRMHNSVVDGCEYKVDFTPAIKQFKEAIKQSECNHEFVSVTDNYGFKIGSKVCKKCGAVEEESVKPFAERFDAMVDSIKIIADQLLATEKRLNSIEKALEKPTEDCKPNELLFIFDNYAGQNQCVDLLRVKNIKFSTKDYLMSFEEQYNMTASRHIRIPFDKEDTSYFFNAIIQLANMMKEEHWQLNENNNTITITL